MVVIIVSVSLRKEHPIALKNILVVFRKNIKLNIAKIDEFNETAIHFNLNGHDVTENFRFYRKPAFNLTCKIIWNLLFVYLK
jgi:hypothetical protein